MQMQVIKGEGDTVVDVTMLCQRTEDVFQRLENVRKGTYQRHGETAKLIMSLIETVANLQVKVAHLERQIGHESWAYNRGNGELFEMVQ